MPSHMAHSNNRMTSANQTLILDCNNHIDNSHINNNNNIIVNNIGDKEQIEQCNDSHNENSHSIELVNQYKKDVTIYLSRQRLIYEAGHQHSKNDQSHQQMGNHQDANLADENSLYLDLLIAVHNIRGMGSNNTAHKLDDLMTLMQNDDTDIVDTITNKSIGYGVAIAVKMKWAKHITRPSQSLHIIAGDFNEIVDPELDKSTLSSNSQTASKHRQNVLHQLQALGFKDTFRLINNNLKAFTYKHSKGEDEELTYSRIDMLWMKAPENIIIKRVYIIPSEGCTNSDHDILITRLHTAEFLVNNRRHTKRAALDQPGIAATTRMDKERSRKANTHGKQSEAADISLVKRQIIDLDRTHRSNIELFQQACRDIASSPNHEDDTEAASGSHEVAKNVINAF
ncbi:hypothetical protein RclHR1_18890001 [Rhizophagus clarus]|uniref:Endonuclease/exonuclease/phosphatase domain-containing protein n=1 Tax=Rhizophagus clarus TaxID=94130 RepID=A0A2Z6QSC0_9GLOM|nr:hypothetical protein RclHR1_18890001 [Rhizophagus clarus]